MITGRAIANGFAARVPSRSFHFIDHAIVFLQLPTFVHVPKYFGGLCFVAVNSQLAASRTSRSAAGHHQGSAS
jgi:hypothetical protein